jgi:hypothetical protein
MKPFQRFFQMWITLSGEGYLSVASFLSNVNIHVCALVSSAFPSFVNLHKAGSREETRPKLCSCSFLYLQCFKAPERSSDPKPQTSKTIFIGNRTSTQTLTDALMREEKRAARRRSLHLGARDGAPFHRCGYGADKARPSATAATTTTQALRL